MKLYCSPSGLNKDHLGCTFISFNEVHRLPLAVRYALTWTRHVVVLDKGSTDGTVEKCKALGAIVINIPYSERGKEDREAIRCMLVALKGSFCDWYISLTAGDMPTPNLINEVAMRVQDTKAHSGLLMTKTFFIW